MRPKGLVVKGPSRLGAWRVAVTRQPMGQPKQAFRFERGNLVPCQPSPDHARLYDQPIVSVYWVLHDGDAVVAVAKMDRFGKANLDFPAFGYWAVFGLGHELRAAGFPEFDPDSGGWQLVRQPRKFLERVLEYRRVNNPARFKARPPQYRSGQDMAKKTAAKAATATKGAKAEKAPKEPKERRMTIARYLYEEVFPREVVGTDEEIIAEIRDQDFCTDKWQDDDKSAKQQLAWYKNKYGKGEFPGSDPNTDYSLNQPYPSNKKRDRAEEAAPEVVAGQKKAGKKAAAKAAPPAKKVVKKKVKAKAAPAEEDDDEDEDE